MDTTSAIVIIVVLSVSIIWMIGYIVRQKIHTQYQDLRNIIKKKTDTIDRRIDLVDNHLHTRIGQVETDLQQLVENKTKSVEDYATGNHGELTARLDSLQRNYVELLRSNASLYRERQTEHASE